MSRGLWGKAGKGIYGLVNSLRLFLRACRIRNRFLYQGTGDRYLAAAKRVLGVSVQRSKSPQGTTARKGMMQY